MKVFKWFLGLVFLVAVFMGGVLYDHPDAANFFDALFGRIGNATESTADSTAGSSENGDVKQKGQNANNDSVMPHQRGKKGNSGTVNSGESHGGFRTNNKKGTVVNTSEYVYCLDNLESTGYPKAFFQNEKRQKYVRYKLRDPEVLRLFFNASRVGWVHQKRLDRMEEYASSHSILLLQAK